MTNQHDTARLSDYLDGELQPAERAELEAHLAECEACAATLDELRAVVTEAGRLPELGPEHDLWPGIEARLAPRGVAAVADVVPIHRRRRVVMTLPQLAAAAIALVLFSASAMWLAVSPGPNAPANTTMAATPVMPAATQVVFADFDQAIAALEVEYQSRRDDLAPETIRVVEKNLAIIDQAIADARQALATDPSSGFLSTHLANALRQKLDLLRQAATIAQTET
jgi:anti-sigma factor RsiW